MVEKKLVIDALRFNYTGMFDIEEFFKEIADWTKENGYERDTKKKLQHVEQDGKKIDYIFELWKDITEDSRSVIRIRALMKDVIDFTLERGDSRRNMQKGHILVIIDGFLETDLEHRWEQKAWYIFVRTLWDKLVWRYWMSRYDGIVSAASYKLYNKLYSYCKRYKV
ncbi:hypothetical protein J4401_01410 [Candidatus Woesearchaeota archaeon]|nr:hypothetical protein [Candidatus Woesearchaeota archaeon]